MVRMWDVLWGVDAPAAKKDLDKGIFAFGLGFGVRGSDELMSFKKTALEEGEMFLGEFPVQYIKLKDLLRTIARKKPTALAGVPTLFNAMLNAPDFARYDLSSLHYCVAAG